MKSKITTKKEAKENTEFIIRQINSDNFTFTPKIKWYNKYEIRNGMVLFLAFICWCSGFIIGGVNG